jgi:hypothetical protein
MTVSTLPPRRVLTPEREARATLILATSKSIGDKLCLTPEQLQWLGLVLDEFARQVVELEKENATD